MVRVYGPASQGIARTGGAAYSGGLPCPGEGDFAGLDKYLVVFAGAGLGGVARFVIGSAIMARYGPGFPLGTLVINVTGSFCVGLAMTLLTERLQLDPLWRLFLVVGVLGGYTTFSTFEYETYQAVRSGAAWLAFLNVAGSVILGYGAVLLGTVIAARP